MYKTILFNKSEKFNENKFVDKFQKNDRTKLFINREYYAG